MNHPTGQREPITHSTLTTMDQKKIKEALEPFRPCDHSEYEECGTAGVWRTCHACGMQFEAARHDDIRKRARGFDEALASLKDQGAHMEERCEQCGQPAIRALRFTNITDAAWHPMCEGCYAEHLSNAEDVNRHETARFGGAYGLVTWEERPIINAPTASAVTVHRMLMDFFATKTNGLPVGEGYLFQKQNADRCVDPVMYALSQHQGKERPMPDQGAEPVNVDEWANHWLEQSVGIRSDMCLQETCVAFGKFILSKVAAPQPTPEVARLLEDGPPKNELEVLLYVVDAQADRGRWITAIHVAAHSLPLGDDEDPFDGCEDVNGETYVPAGWYETGYDRYGDPVYRRVIETPYCWQPWPGDPRKLSSAPPVGAEGEPNQKPQAWWGNDCGWMINDQLGFPRRATEQEILAAEASRVEVPEPRTFTKQEVEAIVGEIRSLVQGYWDSGFGQAGPDAIAPSEVDAIMVKHGLNTDNHG